MRGLARRPRRVEPGPGQESAWDYPRPPLVEPAGRSIIVRHAGRDVARSGRAWRVCETSHAPTYYIPPDDVATELLEPSRRRSACEWKGRARYHHLRVGDAFVKDAAWSYDRPRHRFADIAGHVAFYPARVDACLVDGERARPQAGGFYGGWITSHVVGPFKGEEGTMGW